MPVIPEDVAMDEFVNWDIAAEPSPGSADLGRAPQSDLAAHHQPAQDNHDFDLALANVDGDDFSFWALEHFETSNMVAGAIPAVAAPEPGPVSLLDLWETPDAPCAHCQMGSYTCKRISEGQYRGYCTSCVALRCECSLGFASASEDAAPSATFPSNPWPTLGDHPDASILHEDVQPDRLHSTSAPDLAALTAVAEERNPSPKIPLPPKIGARFSRESVRVLKNWLSTHARYPYPTEKEKESLQKHTGLSKTQIANWLANARRRNKMQPTRSTSPIVRGWSRAIEIPNRRGAPALEHMNPLQRWENSPPEHEPASVTAIASAILHSGSSFDSGMNSPHSLHFTDDSSNRSLCKESSASSVGTSHSSAGSFASAYSHRSRGSFGSFGSLQQRGRRRRRRRTAPRQPDEKTTLNTPLKTFQCTFCTETFRTKHDWQRHEKSLHLSLERWVCAPHGPRALKSETNQICCVFCGQVNPDDAHIDSHNYSTCQERTLEERTFYRKDHLRQHLKLVHNAKFSGWSMESWRVASPEIRSRCGFCGVILNSWPCRVDHLAEHFKGGNTMADWKGDWGFDPPVLEMVENSIPPYLIHGERNAPLPYMASQTTPESPRNAYELIKLELAYYICGTREATGLEPTDEQLHTEACRIIISSEVLSKGGLGSQPAWLRDLIMCPDDLALKAQLTPIGAAEGRLSRLKINGKDNMFEDCPMEKQLHDFVKARQMLGLTALDSELQVEACRILGRMEETSSVPSENLANFLIRLINGSTKWLAPFRHRAHLPRTEDMENKEHQREDPKTIDYTIDKYCRLEHELAKFAKNQFAMGIRPSDEDLQRQARIIVYELADAVDQTAADNTAWLEAFKQRHPQPDVVRRPMKSPLTLEPVDLTPGRPGGSSSSAPSSSVASPGVRSSPIPVVRDDTLVGSDFSNNVKGYRRFAQELRKFVASTMAASNPVQHVPSDEEIQHQARWILYDDPGPFNITPADNAEWLLRFKRSAGILRSGDGPGLPECTSWHIAQGSSGYAPLYEFPKAAQTSMTFDLGEPLSVDLRDGAKPFEVECSITSKPVQGLATRYDPPGAVFCSRELENGLAQFVMTEAAETRRIPTHEVIKAKAREILSRELGLAMDFTRAEAAAQVEDTVLLDKFKTMMRDRLSQGASSLDGDRIEPGVTTTAAAMTAPDAMTGMIATSAAVPIAQSKASPQAQGSDGTNHSPGVPGGDVQINITEKDLNDFLHDMGVL